MQKNFGQSYFLEVLCSSLFHHYCTFRFISHWLSRLRVSDWGNYGGTDWCQGKGITHITQGTRLAGESLKQTFSHYHNLSKNKIGPVSFDSFFPSRNKLVNVSRSLRKKANILNEVWFQNWIPPNWYELLMLMWKFHSLSTSSK